MIAKNRKSLLVIWVATMGDAAHGKVLLIDDNRSIATALSQALATTYHVEVAGSGAFGMYKSSVQSYSAIILDLNLPDMSGLSVCEQMRSRGINTPILILSGETEVMSKIALLDAGANDYLTKPFSLGELKARLRALIRQSSEQLDTQHELYVDDFYLNTATHQVLRSGVEIVLRPKEFAILECLMRRAGSVVSRDKLARHAWRSGDDSWTNTIEVHIKHLRDKVDRPFGLPRIKTVHGLGYRLELAVIADGLTPPEMELMHE